MTYSSSSSVEITESPSACTSHGAKKNTMKKVMINIIILSTIRLLIIVLFLCYLLLWIMMPTTAYRGRWLPRSWSIANSTCFGIQGATISMHTAPILLIAALGCLYLHLVKKCEDNYPERTGNNRLISLWKRPVLVKGPLGIVSTVELAFLSMFIGLLIWSFSISLHVSFSMITPLSAKEEGAQVWEAKLKNAALKLGIVGNICLAFLFFPVTRGSSLLPLVGLTSEMSIKYHIWLGHITMTLLTAHGLLYIAYWGITHNTSEILEWDQLGISNLAGELSLLVGLAIWATSFRSIRRKIFELFFYTHNLYFLFLFFFILHVGISYSCIMLPGLYLFLIDRYLRFLQSRQRVRLVTARILPCQSFELNFAKSPGLTYTCTGIVFINIPSISSLQWHPFTITSNCNLEQDRLSVIIKADGSWSQRLYQMLSSPSAVERLDVSIEGPYGPTSTNFLRHDVLVMVSGGSGITPFISIIRELIFITTTNRKTTPRVLLICAFKHSRDLTMLNLLHPLSGIPSAISALQLQIEAYVTREKEPVTENHNECKIIQFKPNKSDAPISAILGPNSWIWLFAIILSSFIVFLALLGIVDHYYIYPVDHNTNKIYSHTFKALLNILIIFSSIAMTASIVILWKKRNNTMEAAKPIQNIDDRELESFQSQSLLQATKVHFGARPDLKNMLTKCEGSSVGVLVCGPPKMRQDVATICSSSYANNLHFESINFNW